PGAAPEDGFTGYPLTNQLGLPLDPGIDEGVSRWGDYSAAAVDESGVLWGAAEYITSRPRDPQVGNWGSFVTRVPVATVHPPAAAPAPAAQARRDRARGFVPWVAGAVIVVLAFGINSLALHAAETDTTWAWTIATHATSYFMAAGYTGGLYFFVRVLFERRWHR